MWKIPLISNLMSKKSSIDLLMAYDQNTFFNPHDVCIDNDENIYVPQWNSGKTYPLKLTRV